MPYVDTEDYEEDEPYSPARDMQDDGWMSPKTPDSRHENSFFNSIRDQSNSNGLWTDQSISKQRPAYTFGGCGVSRDLAPKDDRAFTPNPASYKAESAIGRQCNSSKATQPAWAFPRAQRSELHEGTASELSPGPAGYGTGMVGASLLVGGTTDKAIGGSGRSTCFGAVRHETALPKWMVPPPPGPGEYRQMNGFGQQHCYAGNRNKETAAAFRFGTEHRDVQCRFNGNEMLSVAMNDGHNPGVKYATGVQSVGRQALSTSRSSPAYKFHKGGGRAEFGSMYQAQLQYSRLEKEFEVVQQRKLQQQEQQRGRGRGWGSGRRKARRKKTTSQQQSEAAAEEILRFPSRTPRVPLHEQNTLDQQWGFRSSGLRRRDDDSLDRRVAVWCEMEREQFNTQMQRLDMMERARSKTKKVHHSS